MPPRAAALYRPAAAYRMHRSTWTDTPIPKDEPMAANPPAGAIIDYVLDAASAGPVTLTITDARGATVQTFSSDDKATPPDLTRIDIAPEWIVPPEPLMIGAGAHRFVWNLHYAAPKPPLAGDDSPASEDGVWAPPGEYWVELAAGSKRDRQRLTVAADPRVHLPASAYARQFALARDIESARVRIAATLADAHRIQDAIAERSHGAGTNTAAATTAAAAAALAAASRELLAISDLAPEKPSPDLLGRPPTTIQGLTYLEEAFRALDHAVDGADGAPGPDALEGYTRHMALLERTLAQWQQFRAGTLARLDAQLKAAGAAPLLP